MSKIKLQKIEELRCELMTLQSKGWGNEAVRVLDQHEIQDGIMGVVCTVQINDYATGKWQETGKRGDLIDVYLFIRETLRWDGRIVMAVAA